MDFGVDQLDIKKKLKPVLGPNVILRLRFGTASNAGAIGGRGYGVLTTQEDSNLEMVSVVLNDHSGPGLTNNTTSNIDTTDTVDSSLGLLDKKSN